MRPPLPGEASKRGRSAQDNRQSLNAVFGILCTGAPWRDRGGWAGLLEALTDDPHFECPMIDASYSKVPHHGQGPVAATRALSALKGTEQQTASGLDAHGRPVRLVLTGGTAADCARAPALATDLPAQYLLADRGYDTIAMVVGAVEQGMVTVILPRSHRKGPRYYDRGLYRLRHMVENAFLNFKQWRAVATLYAERTASVLAICQITVLVLWPSYFDDTT